MLSKKLPRATGIRPARGEASPTLVLLIFSGRACGVHQFHFAPKVLSPPTIFAVQELLNLAKKNPFSCCLGKLRDRREMSPRP